MDRTGGADTQSGFAGSAPLPSIVPESRQFDRSADAGPDRTSLPEEVSSCRRIARTHLPSSDPGDHAVGSSDALPTVATTSH